jgi:hypothetical protein
VADRNDPTEDRLDLAGARYGRGELDHPVLSATVNGRPVLFTLEQQKPAVLAAGFVFLGGANEDLVPARTLTVPGAAPIPLRGFTDDPRVVALYRRFLADALDDGRFTPGPVPIPGA